MGEAAARRKRILLADDEVQNLELLEACLEPLGHEIVCARVGTEAIAFLQRARFDLVILDVMMPGATGFEVLRRFREKRTERCVPVLLLSALTDRASRLRGLELGANDFLTKPLDRSELLARVHTLLSLQDATDALIERTQQLVRLQTLQNELASLLVHDLKTPLSIVSSNLAWLRETPMRPESEAAIDDCRDATHRMLGMVTDLLEIARMEECEPMVRAVSRESLREIADEIAREHLRSLQERRVEMEVDGDGGARANVDRALTRRALENLVDNAVRHTPNGGSILVEAFGDPSPRLVVSNTGTPIPEDELERVFEKFGQGSGAREQRRGSGLGLYFCKLVMEAHGGGITHRSTTTWPTSFTLTFGVPLLSAL